MASNSVAMRAAVLLASVTLLLLPLVSTPVLPFIDFYDHLARYYVLSHLGEPVFAANYASAWQLLPNLGLDLLATPLLGAVAPLTAAKVIAAFLLLVQFSGVLFLHHALWRRFDPLPSALLVGLLYSMIMTWGFTNFLLGLGLVFWNLGLWLRLRDRLPLAMAVCGLGAIVIFFCHGFAFAVYGVLLGSFEVGRWWFDHRGDWRGLIAGLGASLAQAVIPVLLFLQMPTAAATSTTAPTGSNSFDAVATHLSGGTLVHRLGFEIWSRLNYAFRVAYSPFAWLDYATFALVLGLVIWAWRKGIVQFHRWMVLPAAAIGVLCVIMPPTMFGVMRLSDRMPLVLAMLAIGALTVPRRDVSGARLLVLSVAAIAVVRIGALCLGWNAYARDYADFRQVVAAVPKGALLTEVHPHAGEKLSAEPRCDMYRPLATMLGGAVAPLFAFPSQQPLRLIGALHTAQEKWPRRGPPPWGAAPGYFEGLLTLDASSRAFQYVLVCKRDRLRDGLPAGARVAAESGNIALLKIW
jgi:hypothetical protein